MLSRFARGFSASRWLRSASGLRQLAEGRNGQEWVLARGFCAYTVLDGSAVPPRKRAAYAAMAISRFTPFPDTGSHVEWVGDRAMVWAWSRAQATTVDGESMPAPRRILPESLFRGQPQPAAEELVALDEGIEARVWRDGVMVASHWWPEAPGLADWNEFRRGAGLSPASAVPTVDAQPLADRPWSVAKSVGVGEAVGRYRDHLAMAGVATAVAVLAALLVGAAALKVSIWQVEGDIAEREQALEKIIDARDTALQGRADVDALLALRPPAGQLELLTLVSGLMRGSWQLVEWKMQDAQSLEVTARMNNPDARAIVTAWEGSKRFSAVTAEIGGPRQDSVVVKARVLPAPAPSASNARRR